MMSLEQVMALHRLVYVSSATCGMSRNDLRLLQEQAILRNAPAGITGLLIYSAGNFLQLLEGPHQQVADCFGRIQLDRRHSEIRQMLFRPTQERIFPTWRMGLLNIDESRALDRDRLDGVLASAASNDADESAGRAAVELIRDFRRQLPEDARAEREVI